MNLDNALGNALENLDSAADPTTINNDKTDLGKSPLEQPDKQSALPPDQALKDSNVGEKIVIDGKEWTPDELKRAIMLNKDYTAKTQEIAKQRQEFEKMRIQVETEKKNIQEQLNNQKFESNYAKDLAMVKSKPHLLSEFLKVYPKNYHDKLFEDLKVEDVDHNTLKLQRDLHETRQTVDSFKTEREQEKLASIDQTFEAQETKLKQKYPDMNLDQTYNALLGFARQNNIDMKNLDSKNINLMLEKMEAYAKQSHEEFETKVEERMKAKAKAQIDANKKATDIGKGGSAPSAPAAKVKLKDTLDEMMKHFNG